ncbi:NAD-dependent deacetylase [Nesidiocoris tenuis]|uniref:NAD-dependent deacetylase n=1 Tax=Nesidiocoris tenuis TaxID=355587 RepID=A0ABN7AW49_9HEMI|nr:NAD-dependent deacetylase [Nesidiocoris tenuis]
MAQIKANGLGLSKKSQDNKLPASLRCIVNKIEDGSIKNVVTLVGAGISTAAGIPDFRSPSSGLYDKLQEYNLPFKTAIFDGSYFEQNPKPLFRVLRDCFFKTHPKPTKTHFFVKLLEEKGVLRRHYTQNIDGLDRLAGISHDKLVEAHGTMQSAHCSECQEVYSLPWMMLQLESNPVPKCAKCPGVVRPDIILFGEYLPDDLTKRMKEDVGECDLLIVMGTSLAVHPVSTLVTSMRPQKFRIFINKSNSGNRIPGVDPCCGRRYEFPDKQVWVEASSCDVIMYGDCDDCIDLLTGWLGWSESLIELIQNA